MPRDTADDNNTNNSDWIACKECEITDTPMFTGSTGLKEEIHGQRTPLHYFSMVLGNLQTVLYIIACCCFVLFCLLILVCLSICVLKINLHTNTVLVFLLEYNYAEKYDCLLNCPLSNMAAILLP